MRQFVAAPAARHRSNAGPWFFLRRSLVPLLLLAGSISLYISPQSRALMARTVANNASGVMIAGLWPFRVFIFARGEGVSGKAENPASMEEGKPSDGYDKQSIPPEHLAS
ncbi:hypothetical protein Naga_101518g2, partial [Nannochloropsis gaditana]